MIVLQLSRMSHPDFSTCSRILSQLIASGKKAVFVGQICKFWLATFAPVIVYNLFQNRII